MPIPMPPSPMPMPQPAAAYRMPNAGFGASAPLSPAKAALVAQHGGMPVNHMQPLNINGQPLPAQMPLPVMPAKMNANGMPHGSTLAAKPQRPAHPTLPGRDVYGRLMPGTTLPGAKPFKAGKAHAAPIHAAKVAAPPKATAPKMPDAKPSGLPKSFMAVPARKAW